MAWRESIEIPPLSHGNAPIPMASRVGNMLFTSGIFGRDGDTNELPESAAEQCANCLKNLGRVLEKAGAKPEDVAQVAVYLKDNATRPLFNEPWLKMFPDEHSRPARHAHIVPGLAAAIQIQAIAVIQDTGKQDHGAS